MPILADMELVIHKLCIARFDLYASLSVIITKSEMIHLPMGVKAANLSQMNSRPYH